MVISNRFVYFVATDPRWKWCLISLICRSSICFSIGWQKQLTNCKLVGFYGDSLWIQSTRPPNIRHHEVHPGWPERRNYPLESGADAWRLKEDGCVGKYLIATRRIANDSCTSEIIFMYELFRCSTWWNATTICWLSSFLGVKQGLIVVVQKRTLCQLKMYLKTASLVKIEFALF